MTLQIVVGRENVYALSPLSVVPVSMIFCILISIFKTGLANCDHSDPSSNARCRVMNFDGALKVFWTSSPISIFLRAALRTPRRRMLCSTFSFKIPPTLFRKRREYWFSLPLFPRHFHRAITRQQCDNQTKQSFPKVADYTNKILAGWHQSFE